MDWLERTQLLVSKKGLEKLTKAHVIIVGLGGVGSFAAEFITRAGIGNLQIIDGDIVDTTNKNRQLPALTSTVGKQKATVMKERLLDINPALQIVSHATFLNPEDMETLITKHQPDYIIDCIDSITPKITLLATAKKHKIPIISVMGAGGKLDPSKVTIRDISNTSECLLAKNVRKRLKKMNIKKGIRCVFSTEKVITESLELTDGTNFKKSYYGTISYMPAVMGLYAASEVIRKLLENQDN